MSGAHPSGSEPSTLRGSPRDSQQPCSARTVQGGPVPHDTARALQAALVRELGGDVRFDRLSRTLYSTDASIYEIIPVGVVLPRSIDDVTAVVKACAAHGVPIVARGAGTGLAGGAVGHGLQIDFSRYMNRLVELDVAARTVRVQPGLVLDELNRALAPHGLHFAPDVATSSRATIGGMIANNSCGAHSVVYGQTIDHVAELTAVLSDGSVVSWGTDVPQPATDLQGRVLDELRRVRTEDADEVAARFPKILRQNGGYALDRLHRYGRARVGPAPFRRDDPVCPAAGDHGEEDDPDAPLNPMPILCGSEGTLGIVVEAVLKLEPLPAAKGILAVHFNTTGTVLGALAATPRILEHRPAAVELIDRMIIDAAFRGTALQHHRPLIRGDPDAVLIVEFYDDSAEAVGQRIEKLEAELRAAGAGYAWTRATSAADQAGIWEIRRSGLGLLMSDPGDDQPYAFIEDAAVDPRHLHDYIERLAGILADEGVSRVGYYAHASVGELHVRPVLNLKRQADVERMVRIADAVSSLVLEYGGAMTGEHGDGLLRSCWTEKMYGPQLYEAFRRVKRAFDPEYLFNPGKIVDAWPMTEHLRYGADFEAASFPTTLDFSTHGGMAGLAGMCSGVGQCRQRGVGTMCPSYAATGDEKHTPRARANALRAALSNRGLLEGIDDEALGEVMDLCLACKACATECPTGADVAKLKYEWLSQRNLRRGASKRARMVASAPRWAVWGSRLAPLSNLVLGSRPVRRLMQRHYGLDARIRPPRYAHYTFRHWMRRHRQTAADRPKPTRGPVIYHVDTWTNHFHPEVGIAAVRLLEAAGHRVLTPVLHCCGRPAIGQGLLTEVALSARMNVEALALHVDRGARVVGTEPSCVLTFVDEYPGLVRSDDAAALAGRSGTIESFLADLLRKEPDALRFRAPDRPLLYHGHCHQKALVTTRDAMALLRTVYGDLVREIDSGCCGMAGVFGHEADHYEIARAVGEERLFEAVRSRGDAEIAVSGFSCRHQIEHHCGVGVRHVVEHLAGLLEV